MKNFIHTFRPRGVARLRGMAVRVSIILLLAVGVLACARDLERLVFELPNGAVALRRSDMHRGGGEGSLAARGRTTFALKTPVRAGDAALHLRLVVDGLSPGREDLEVELLGDGEAVIAAFALPPVPRDGLRLDYSRALPQATLRAVRIQSRAARPEERAEVVELGLIRASVETSLTADVYRSWGGAGLREAADGRLIAEIPALRGPVVVALEYAFLAGAAQVELAGAEGAARRYELRPRGEIVHFHEAVLGFAPRRLVLDGFGQALRAIRVQPGGGRWHRGSVEDPIDIDFTMLLDYPHSAWRRPDFELFRWNQFPKILILDSRDFRTQERFFSRLAFFVEKKGYRGRLLTNAELEGKHGWNAHNYNPEGLSEFFNAVQDSSFPLNEEEIELRDILMAHGVLRMEDGRFVPGVGAILAISQQPTRIHRRILLLHEGFHGIFESEPDFRKLTERLWQELPSEERTFWMSFLDWRTYDVGFEYLVVNEFQAFLLQQPLAALNDYFKVRIGGRMAREKPERAAWLESFFAAHPDSFGRPARVLNAWIARELGFQAGDLFNLREINITN